MPELLSSQLIGRTAMTSGGYPIGKIDSIVADTETGKIVYLLVNASGSAVTTQKTDAKGRSVIAFNSLKISGENVIIG